MTFFFKAHILNTILIVFVNTVQVYGFQNNIGLNKHIFQNNINIFYLGFMFVSFGRAPHAVAVLYCCKMNIFLSVRLLE